MTAAAPTWPVAHQRRLPIPAAAFELLAYLIVVAAATLAFTAGWLPVNGAVVLTVVLLASLIALSWVHLGQGRHPVFLFLCTLMLFQGGRLIAYCLGAEQNPMRVILMASNFDPSREVQGTTLLCVALAGVCVYATSRLTYRPVPVPDTNSARKYLPYLYLLYFLSLPVQLFKNYRYYQFAQEHGGYLSIFLSHKSVTATVPFLVRIVPLIAFPVFVAIFVFERRKPPLYLVTILYLATASLLLALGARGGTISLILVLWWVGRVKSTKRSRVMALAIFLIGILFIGNQIRRVRESDDEAPRMSFVGEATLIEGAPMNVTEIAIQYRSHFSPYSGSYLFRELQNAFVAGDKSNYYRGHSLDADASVFLSPAAFNAGAGVASSYVAEAYIAGTLPAVILVSLGIGFALSVFHKYSSNPLLLLMFALSLPEILIMPRAQLLDWASVLARNTISVLLLVVGWKTYSLITSIRHPTSGNSSQAPVVPAD